MNSPLSSLKPATIGEAVDSATRRLNGIWGKEARLLCEHLIAEALGCGRLELYMIWHDALNTRRLSRIEEGIARLAGGEPLQYVLGHADFMGLKFRVDRNCLIPRPETEELVEHVSGFAGLWENKRPLIADVGTGCGCIAVSLALKRPEGRYVAVDVCRGALNMAEKNAETHGTTQKIRFRNADLLAGIPDKSLDAVISNPPYVSTPEWNGLERHIRNHEPRVALDGGPGGLEVIGRLIEQAGRALKQGGYIFIETGPCQRADAQKLLRRAGFCEYEAIKDLAGRHRIVSARK